MQELNPLYRWFTIPLLGPGRRTKLYTYRGLTRKEIRISSTKKNQTDSEDYILTCCVPGEDISTMLGGTSLRLLEEIYKASGLTKDEIPLLAAVDWLKDPYGRYEAAAVISLPNISLEHLDTCDPSYYYRYVLCGKIVFEKMFGMSPDKAFGEEEGSGEITTKSESFPGTNNNTFTWKKSKK